MAATAKRNWRDEIYNDEPATPVGSSNVRRNWRDEIHNEPIPTPIATTATKRNWRDEVHNETAIGSEKEKGEKTHIEYLEERKTDVSSTDSERGLKLDKEESGHKDLREARDLVTQVLSLEDDPTQNPLTFRMWFIGIGLSVFGGTVTSINTFKPQSVHIHLVFVAVISYVLGTLMANFIPRRGAIGRFLNPGPFNKKEHSAICIMVAAASSTPEAMTVLAVQKLYYNINPNAAIGVFLILSTQMLGYGLAGVLRRTLVYPSNMLYPTNLPTAALLESLHKERKVVKKKLRVFNYGFIALFLWQAFPQYITPLLSGLSVFCLAMQHSPIVTHLFGGSSANEGLGFLSLSFDWTMVSAHGNPLWIPFRTLMNTLVGYGIGIALFMGIFYHNVWDAQKFPFMSTTLFSENSTVKKYVQYNQTGILNSKYQVDADLLAIQGLPRLTASHAMGMTLQNLAIMAAITHMVIWHWSDIKSAGKVFEPLKDLFKPKNWNLRVWQWKTEQPTREEADAIDPHYGVMQSYKDVPNSWFGLIWLISAVVGLISSRMAGSTLEVWAFFVAVMLAGVLITPFAALTAMFGFPIMVQPLIQMLGAYMLPGRPLANLYFSTYGFNSLYMAKNMLKDLKLGQYVHLAPRVTFTVQIFGTILGCLMSYVMMEQITTEKRDILLSIQGTNVWSGQHIQTHNAAAVTWGGLAKQMYGFGSRYQSVSMGFIIGMIAPIPFYLIHKYVPGGKRLHLDYWNITIICGYISVLSHGTTSGYLLHFIVGFASQFFLRKYRTNWFIKYNYILSAGLDGGAQVINFLLTFAVFGAGGKVVKFPAYWGNNYRKGNLDYCMRDVGLGPKGGKHGRGGGGGSAESEGGGGGGGGE